MPDLSRRGLLLGAGALALAGCGRASTPRVTPTAPPTGPARERLTALMDAYGRNTDLLGVSVKDLRTQQTFAFRGDYDGQCASMAKVMIVAMALRKARAEGRDFGFDNYTRASKAIISSDNDSADQLWEYAGGREQYTRLAADLGLRNTRHDDRSEFWSWTHTTPDDQRTLAELVLRGTPALHVEDRTYLLDLMSRTTASQTWGVGHDKARDVHVQMKNGWVQFRSLDNLWAVNSMGHVEGRGRNYTAAIMCRMPSFDEGKALVDAIGADLFTALEGELT